MEKSLHPEAAAFREALSEAIRVAGGAGTISLRSGVPEKTIYNWMNGVNAQAAITLHRIANACRIPLSSLFEPKDAAGSGSPLLDLAGFVAVPILDVYAAAGDGADNEAPRAIGTTVFPRDRLRALGISPANVAALQAHGDSMFPTIVDRHIVMIDTDTSRVRDGAVYAIWSPNGLRLKRIQQQMDGSLVLISDNRDLYGAEHLSASEAANLRFVGRVFWTERFI